MSATTDPDTLRLDVPAARELVRALGRIEEDLTLDHHALVPLLDAAGSLLRGDRRGPLRPLAVARRAGGELAADLADRLAQVDATRAGLDHVDRMSRSLAAWPYRLDEGGRDLVRAERLRLLSDLVSDADHVRRLEVLLDEGASAAEAFAALDAELRLDARIAAVREGFGVDDAAAREMVARVDLALPALQERGIPQEQALAALAVVERFDLDLEQALTRADRRGIGLLESLGHLLMAQAIGVSIGDYDALSGLAHHFDAFDTATGTAADQRVSVGDLAFVVDHPRRFTPSQIAAAQALLDRPSLRTRLDTAAAETDLFSPDGFGSSAPGDGLIAEVDLQSFLFKAQLHTILGEHADAIDVANDPSGVVDGFHSRNDLVAFLADNPDLPEAVREAATIALENGWFDQSWWDEHKDEVAMGIALLAAGVVVVATGGTASVILVVGVGAAAAGATTVVINAATGEPLLDDALANAAKGGFVASGVHGVSAGVIAHRGATTGVARVAAISGATAGAADVVAAGGVDLLVDDRYEDTLHEIAGHVGNAAGGVDVLYGAGEWVSRRTAVFDSVEEQLAALSERVSRQRQARHVAGSPLHEHGGWFDDPADAQRVLDAVHDGSAEVLGITRGQDLLVRHEAVKGIHATRRPVPVEIETSVFTVKGTAHPSVVPTDPGRDR